MKIILLTLFLIFPVFGFGQIPPDVPVAVKNILVKAGKNKSELEKVITYFHKTGDRLKIRAIYFLIANMDAHYSEDYYWEDKSEKKVPFNELDYTDFNQAISAFKKLKVTHPDLRPHPFTSPDIKTIKADFLIQNINQSFQHWKSSAGYKNISFNDFCEYILPYRVSVEPLQNWRLRYNKDFSWVATKNKSEGLASSLSYISADFRSWFTNSYSIDNRKEPLPRLGALQLLQRKKGPCEDIADLVAFTLRSQGIPAAINYIPYWATSSSGHFLNTAFDGKMRAISFDVAGTPAVNNVLAREPSKVLRLTYSKQQETIAGKEKINNIPPGFMRSSTYLDVTKQFWGTEDLTCKLFAVARQPKYSFVCVFNELGWKPTWWGSVNQNLVTYKNMPKGAVYLPAYYIDGKITPAGYPVLQGYNHKTVLEPNTARKKMVVIKEQQNYILFRPNKRYRLFYWQNAWKLVGERLTAINTHEIVFNDVPENALLLLAPEYSKGKERPFIVINDGEIKWF